MINNGFKNNNVPVKEIDSNVLSKEAEKLAHWKKHFESILNTWRPEHEQVVEIPPAVEDLDICIDPDRFRKIWESEMIPEAWKTGLIVKLTKMGDFGDCNKWRGVTLLLIASKVFSKIIHTRLDETLDAYIRQEQAGFCHGCSCSEILEQSKEWNAPLYANF